MAIRILVNGAKGKMGQETVKLITTEPDFVLTAQADREDNLAQLIQTTAADVVVDFTTAEVGFRNTQTIIEAGARPVIGTTGFSLSQIDELKKHCEHLKRGAIIAPNFSLGAILMMKFAQEAARYLPHVEIIELHHDRKLDAPSGTALKTAQLISQVKEKTQPKVKETETLAHARGALSEDIRIHSVRLPGLVAHQQVIFGGVGETLTIKHDMMDRQAAMPGVALACRKVMELNHLISGLENLIN
jgi:4-hydroxy-tetrahydrodipicolinate reductase